MKFRIGARVAVALALGAAGFAGTAMAQGSTSPVPNTPAAHAVVARQQNYKQLGRAFKTIGDELKKDAPDKAVIAPNAAKVKTLAAQIPTWFPNGSGAEAGVKTAAKPQIWSDPAGFAAAAERLKVETTKLQQFADAGDLGAIKTQFAATGAACKNCHDKYRVPDQH
jgi:cytochrome c556